MTQYYDDHFQLQSEEQNREAREHGQMATWMSDDGVTFRTPPIGDLAIHARMPACVAYIVSFREDAPQFPVTFVFKNMDEVRAFRRAFIYGNA